jgi:hypothetical protein
MMLLVCYFFTAGGTKLTAASIAFFKRQKNSNFVEDHSGYLAGQQQQNAGTNRQDIQQFT